MAEFLKESLGLPRLAGWDDWGYRIQYLMTSIWRGRPETPLDVGVSVSGNTSDVPPGSVLTLKEMLQLADKIILRQLKDTIDTQSGPEDKRNMKVLRNYDELCSLVKE